MERGREYTGENQVVMIDKKIISVSKKFDIPTNRTIPVSAEGGYNLASLIDLMVEVLPNEKKYSVTREAKEEVVSEKASGQAAQGFLNRIKEIAGTAWEWIKDEGEELVLRVAIGIFPAVANSVAKYFRRTF